VHTEAPTRRSSLSLILSLLLLGTAACGPWKRVGEPEPEVTRERIPQLFDPGATFRQMGLLTDPGPIGFVGTARILASADDSLLLVVALSMHNSGLAFRRDGSQFVADYRVETVLRQGPAQVAMARRDERVRVSAFQETQRSDESIIFQQFLHVPPGAFTLTISVRDQNSPNAGRVEMPITIPALARNAISLPIAVYQATPRTTLDSAPSLVANPRSTVEYGADSLRFYIETYGTPPGTVIHLSAIDAASQPVWQEELHVDSLAPVRGYIVNVPPGDLSIGRYELRMLRDTVPIATTPFLVAFSDVFAAANLEDIVSLLRYFASPDTLRALLATPSAERAAAWQRFWRETDPNPATQENEAIEQYLQRVQIANERFRTEGVAGWLTERGEVFINLGDPSEIVDARPDVQGRGRTIVWNYYEYRLTLYFYDDAGFGRFRLEPRSRAEFQRVVNRLRNR